MISENKLELDKEKYGYKKLLEENVKFTTDVVKIELNF